MWQRIKDNPAVVVNLVVAVLGAAVLFGIDVSPEATDRVVALVLAAIALAGGVTRALVVPAHDPIRLRNQLDRLAWKPK